MLRSLIVWREIIGLDTDSRRDKCRKTPAVTQSNQLLKFNVIFDLQNKSGGYVTP